MKIGREKVARARVSDDTRRLENVEVIGDGMAAGGPQLAHSRSKARAGRGDLFVRGEPAGTARAEAVRPADRSVTAH